MRPPTGRPGGGAPPPTPNRLPAQGEGDIAVHEPDRIQEHFTRILADFLPGGGTSPPPLVTASAPPAYGAVARDYAERPELEARWWSAPGQIATGQEGVEQQFGTAGTATFGYDDPREVDEEQRTDSFAQAPTPRLDLQAESFAGPAWSKAAGEAPSLSPRLVWSMFPELFSFSGLLLYLVPTWLVVHLSHDGDVVYWMGPWCELAEFLPLVFLGAFIVHVKLKRPHKPTVLLCLLLPAAILLVLSDVLTSMASDYSNRLISTDCDTFAGKRSLERSWQAAKQLYESCLEDTVKARGDITMEAAQKLFRIQDCEEYAQAFSQHKRDWEYLFELEEVHRCGGWCTAGPPLWTLEEVRDSCSAAVSQVLAGKVTRSSKQVTFFTVVVLVLTTLGNILLGPTLRSAGLPW